MPLGYALRWDCPAPTLAALLRAGADRNCKFVISGTTYTAASFAERQGKQQVWAEAVRQAEMVSCLTLMQSQVISGVAASAGASLPGPLPCSRTLSSKPRLSPTALQ